MDQKEFSEVIEDFRYILSKIYDKVTYTEALVLYNLLIEMFKNKEDPREKIEYLANIIRQKENDIDG